ncbi:MAG: hypothetical protein COX30_03720 [Candidatus Moranbacteria bacterium CG23_combo_of_CG06-09_8_20_14_all_39_10]|nr:MAG: hypothetical protein COX30_03720 [Candidatus Moranbacteria bacterium CG23_combo_of_CG06-09_8_20_14_all_39_10]
MNNNPMEKMVAPKPKQEINDEINEGLQDHGKPSQEQNEIILRENEVASFRDDSGRSDIIFGRNEDAAKIIDFINFDIPTWNEFIPQSKWDEWRIEEIKNLGVIARHHGDPVENQEDINQNNIFTVDYYLKKHPEIIAQAEKKIDKLMSYLKGILPEDTKHEHENRMGKIVNRITGFSIYLKYSDENESKYKIELKKGEGAGLPIEQIRNIITEKGNPKSIILASFDGDDDGSGDNIYNEFEYQFDRDLDDKLRK